MEVRKMSSSEISDEQKLLSLKLLKMKPGNMNLFLNGIG